MNPKTFSKGESRKILMGTNALINKWSFLSLKQLSIHMHILGSSGMGKTFFLEHLIKSLIDLKAGVCVIDPHGDLYQRLLKYVVRKRLEEKVILFDPNDRDWAVGLNYLEYDEKNFSATSHASLVMRGLSRVFGGENQDIKPQLSRWERNTLIPLVQTHQTLVEIPLFPDFSKFVCFTICNNLSSSLYWFVFGLSNNPFYYIISNLSGKHL